MGRASAARTTQTAAAMQTIAIATLRKTYGAVTLPRPISMLATIEYEPESGWIPWLVSAPPRPVVMAHFRGEGRPLPASVRIAVDDEAEAETLIHALMGQMTAEETPVKKPFARPTPPTPPRPAERAPSTPPPIESEDDDEEDSASGTESDTESEGVAVSGTEVAAKAETHAH